MIEIKISGRGGQGAVLASQIVASALFNKGMAVQAFPSFGAERRGAPVSAFVRADSDDLTLRCGLQNPDWLILFDPEHLANPMIMKGITSKSCLLVNCDPRKLSAQLPADMPAFKKILCVDATGIAEGLKLKTSAYAIVNTAMTGAFAKASGVVDIDGVADVIMTMAPIKKEQNVAAARQAFEEIKEIQI